MKTILVLGATGRTGRFVCKHRPDNATVYAGLRQASYVEGQRSLPDGADALRVVDIDDHTSLSTALEGVDVVVNAIRLREDIAASALVELHQSIVAARYKPRTLCRPCWWCRSSAYGRWATVLGNARLPSRYLTTGNRSRAFA